MRKRALLTALALVVPLAACSGGDRGANPLLPGPTTPNPDPKVSGLLEVPDNGDGWVIDGAHYVGINEETGEIIVKVNNDFNAGARRGNAHNVDMTFTSIDPTSGVIGWEQTLAVPYSIVVYDYMPAPPVPGHKPSSQIGTYVSTGGAQSISESVSFDFPGTYFDVTTGEFVDPPADGVGGAPYLTRLYSWDHTRLTVGDETFAKLGEFATSVQTTGVLLLNEDLAFLGGDFGLVENQTDTRPFTITFLDAAAMKTIEVDMPEEWYPKPTSDSFGDFENNLLTVPLDDGILWNVGGEEWLVISPDGIQETITIPENIHLRDAEPGTTHATIDEFLAALDEISAMTGTKIVSPTESMLVFTPTGSALEWEELNGEHRSGQADLYGPIADSGIPSVTIAPDATTLLVDSRIFKVDGGEEIAGALDMRFLASTEEYDIYSSEAHAFRAGDSPMGTIVGIPRD